MYDPQGRYHYWNGIVRLHRRTSYPTNIRRYTELARICSDAVFFNTQSTRVGSVDQPKPERW